MSDTTEAPAAAEHIPAPAEDPEIEARARRMGWLPKDQYRKDPATWQPAADFVERAETMLPLAVARNRKLERDLESLNGRYGETQQMLADLVQRTRKAEEIGYKRARREIEQERSRAVAAGDTEAFAEAEARLQELGAPPPEPPRTVPPAPAAQQPQTDPVVQAWIGQNAWFNANPEANAVAVALHGVISQQMPAASLEEKLAETTRRMRQRMPELFGESGQPPNPRRGAPPAVASSHSAGGRPANPRSFDAMPAEAKREYDRSAKMLAGKGEPFTKEEFARYYWDQFEETV